MRTLLVSAYSCEPLKGSEPAVGWNWVIELAKRNRVHVITRANNQTVIEQHLPNDIKGNIVFHLFRCNISYAIIVIYIKGGNIRKDRRWL